jgi:hypothetical protein
MGMLENAEATLRKWRRSNLAKLVSYTCSLGTIAVYVTQAETRVDSDNGEVIVRSRVVDWIVEAADLKVSGQQIVPKPGDSIVLGSLAFELAALGDEPCYRVHGRDYASYRLHTKQVGV